MCYLIDEVCFSLTETELNEQVEGSMNILPSYDAIVTRTQLAQVSL